MAARGVGMANQEAARTASEKSIAAVLRLLQAMNADGDLASHKQLKAQLEAVTNACDTLANEVINVLGDKEAKGAAKEAQEEAARIVSKVAPNLGQKKSDAPAAAKADKPKPAPVPAVKVDAASNPTVAAMSTAPDTDKRNKLVKGREERIADLAKNSKEKHADVAAFAKALGEVVKKIAALPLEEAAKESEVAKWLFDLPKSIHKKQHGFEYTADQVNMMWVKGQYIFTMLSGTRDKKEWLAEMEAQVKKSVKARLEASGASDAEVDAEVKVAMDEYKSRMQLTPTTPWVIRFFEKKLPTKSAFEFLLAMFIYTVDAKICDCKSIEECKAKPKKHKVKPAPPENFAAHGRNAAMWAVGNWAIRVEDDKSSPEDVRNACTEVLNPFSPYTDSLDCALASLPQSRRVVFRGLPVALARTYRINTEVCMAPFTSTSLVGEEALKFMDASKPGTFFILRMHSASCIDFMSWYPEQAEALLGRSSLFMVKSKTSRTVLRMLQCKFDIVTLVEAGGDNDDGAIVDALVSSAKHTVFIYKHYLSLYVETRVSIGKLADKEKTGPFKLLGAVEDWLMKERGHALLFGDGGTGKTSATLAVQSFLTGKDVFTVFIPLPTVTGGPTKQGALDAFVLDRLDLTKDQYLLMVKKYKVVLLLDSLDECGSVTAKNICTGIATVNPLCAKARIVVSCRTEMAEACEVEDEHKIIDANGASKVTTWTVSSFTKEDVTTFIQRSAAGVAADQVMKMFPEEVTQHPLRLQMLVQVLKAEGGQKKFQGIADLGTDDVYQAYIEDRVKLAAKEAGNITEDTLLKGLTKIAWQMLRSGQWLVSVEEALDKLKCPPSVMAELPVRVEDPDDTSSPFTFWHRSIGEFLVALELTKDLEQPLDVAMEGIHSQRQVGVLKFLLEMGTPEQIDAAVEQLMEHCGAPHQVIAYLRGQSVKIAEKHTEKSEKYFACITKLAKALLKTGQVEEQAKQLERILALKETMWGPNDVRIATTLDDLAYAFRKLDRPRVATLERALDLKERGYGKEDYRIASTLGELAIAYGNKGMRKIETLERALDVLTKKYGPNSIKLCDILFFLGRGYGNKEGQSDKCLETCGRALTIMKKHYGPDHFEVGRTLFRLGNAYGAMGDENTKIKLMEEALEIQGKHYGFDHFELASTYNNLGNAYGQIGNQEKKLDVMEKALVLKERHYGANNFNVASTLHNLGNVHKRLGHKKEWAHFMERAFRNKINHYGKASKEWKESYVSCCDALKDIGDKAKLKEVEDFVDKHD